MAEQPFLSSPDTAFAEGTACAEQGGRACAYHRCAVSRFSLWRLYHGPAIYLKLLKMLACDKLLWQIPLLCTMSHTRKTSDRERYYK